MMTKAIRYAAQAAMRKNRDHPCELTRKRNSQGGFLSNKDRLRVVQAFARQGFTDGYYTARKGGTGT